MIRNTDVIILLRNNYISILSIKYSSSVGPPNRHRTYNIIYLNILLRNIEIIPLSILNNTQLSKNRICKNSSQRTTNKYKAGIGTIYIWYKFHLGIYYHYYWDLVRQWASIQTTLTMFCILRFVLLNRRRAQNSM